MITNIIYFITFVLSINVCVCKKYNNYTMYRAIPVNSTHIEFLADLDEFYDVNIWRPAGTVFKPVDFVISPSDQPSFLRDADRHGIYLTTVIKDVQRAFDQQTVKAYIRRDMESFDWSNYFRLDDIYHWLKDLADANPTVMHLESIGKSHEDRDIIAVRIAFNKHPRSTIMVEGGIHAREWISPAVVTYLIHQILHADTSDNLLLKEVANTHEWYFVPVLNVDGYEYTHIEDRLWRKNRNGKGVDLNRNFGYAFGTTGISWSPESDVYCGEKPFSEKESRAMAEFIKQKSKALKFYISFHSYGQYMILPFANSKQHLGNFGEMYKICKKAARKLSETYNTKYEIGTAYDTVGYFSSGVSGCWVKSSFRTPYVVTFELRDTGVDGFALPPDQILPTCKETMDGLLSLLNNTKNLSLKGFSNAKYHLSDTIVIVFNVILFILVRFD